MSHNLSLCQILVKKAVEAGAKVVSTSPFPNHFPNSSKALFLPEATDYIGSSPAESISLARPMESSLFMLGLRKAAKDSSLAINVGIHVPASNGKIGNRSCWINEKGDIESYYDKLHLFDYGALRESNSVEAGKEIVSPVETVVGRVGLTICFDVSCSGPPLQTEGSYTEYRRYVSQRSAWRSSVKMPKLSPTHQPSRFRLGKLIGRHY
jgi:predicted amidohydrolase